VAYFHSREEGAVCFLVLMNSDLSGCMGHVWLAFKNIFLSLWIQWSFWSS